MLENLKKSGIHDRKDFGRVEASLYLINKGLLACLLACFCQEFRGCGQREADAVKRHLKCCRIKCSSHNRDPPSSIIVLLNIMQYNIKCKCKVKKTAKKAGDL